MEVIATTKDAHQVGIVAVIEFDHTVLVSEVKVDSSFQDISRVAGISPDVFIVAGKKTLDSDGANVPDDDDREDDAKGVDLDEDGQVSQLAHEH